MFFYLSKLFFQISFHLKEILYVAKKKKKTKHRDRAPLTKALNLVSETVNEKFASLN